MNRQVELSTDGRMSVEYMICCGKQSYFSIFSFGTSKNVEASIATNEMSVLK